MSLNVVQALTETPQFVAAMMTNKGSSSRRKRSPDGQRIRAAILRIVLPDRTVAAHFNAFYDRLESVCSPRLSAAEVAKRINDGSFLRACYEMPKWDILAPLLLPALGQAVLKYIDADARRRLSEGVILLRQYKNKHGQWPDRLDEIKAFQTPAMTDPYTNRAFVFKRKKNGWILYSVGANLRDDGGARRKDIAVAYPIPSSE